MFYICPQNRTDSRRVKRYFSAYGCGDTPSAAKPVIRKIDPTSLNCGTTNTIAAQLTIEEDNLNGVSAAKAIFGNSPVVVTGVLSNANTVKCSFEFVDKPAGHWDIVVIDAFDQQGPLPAALDVA